MSYYQKNIGGNAMEEFSVVQEISDFINRVGFPVFVAVWSLIKQSKDTQRMSDTLLKVHEALNNLCNKIG